MKFQSGSGINFWRALLISLLLHALILWQPPSAVTGGTAQSQALSPLNSLRASLLTRPETQQYSPALPAKQKVKSGAVPPLPQPPAPPAMAAPLPVQPVAAASLANPASNVGDAGLDANGIRQYRLSLASAARRYRLYPSLALANGWSGTAEIAVAIAASGAAQPVQLQRSSGYALLDAAALEMMAQAALHTAVPASLRGQQFSIILPVEFERNAEPQERTQ